MMKTHQLLGLFENIIKPRSNLLIKYKIGPVAFKEPKPTSSMKESANKAYYGQALPQFEKLLKNNEYLLGGSEFTLIDMVFFNQMMTVEALNFE